jgi:uncharacterized protein YjaZ
MGGLVDDRAEEKLATKFVGPYASDAAWERLNEQAENLAQQDGMPFQQALKILTGSQPS